MKRIFFVLQKLFALVAVCGLLSLGSTASMVSCLGAPQTGEQAPPTGDAAVKDGGLNDPGLPEGKAWLEWLPDPHPDADDYCPSVRQHCTSALARVLQGSIHQKTTLRGCFLVQGILDITAEVTLEKGSILLFTQGAGLQVTGAGSLQAVGDYSHRLCLMGAKGAQWRGVYINTRKTSRFESVFLADTGGPNLAGGDAPPAALTVGSNGSARIANSMITKCKSTGVLALDGADIPSTYEIFFVDVDGPMMQLPPPLLRASWGAIGLSGNKADYILLKGALPITQDTEFDNGLRYRIASTLIIEANVKIYSDTTLEFASGTGIKVQQGASKAGSLSIDVSLGSRSARLTGTSPVQGHWKGIYIATSSPLNRISKAVIEYGGGGSWRPGLPGSANITLDAKASLKLENCAIENSSGYGLLHEATATLTKDNVSYADNKAGDEKSF